MATLAPIRSVSDWNIADREDDAIVKRVSTFLEPNKEAMLDDELAVRAVAHVEAALSLYNGLASSNEAPRFDSRATASAFLFIRRIGRTRRVVLLAYCLLGLVERPPYCERDDAQRALCHHGHPKQELSTWPPLTADPRVSLCLALLLQTLLLVDSAIHLLVEQKRARFFCLGLIWVSSLEVIGRLAVPWLLPTWIWPYRLFRPLILAAGSSRMREGVIRVVQAAWGARHLYLSVAVSLVTATWIARCYFFDQGAPFDSSWATLLALFTCMTTANYPDVQTPIVNQGGLSWLSFVFFAWFLVINIYVLLNMVFSDIYSKHGDMVREDWCRRVEWREAGLERAFDLLASPRGADVPVDQKTVDIGAWCEFYCCWHRWAPIVHERSPQNRAEAIFDFVQQHFWSDNGDPRDAGRPRLLSADGAGGFVLPRKRAVPDTLDLHSFQALVLTLGDRDVICSLRNARAADALKVTMGPRRHAVAGFLARTSMQRVLDVMLCVNLVMLVGHAPELHVGDMRQRGAPFLCYAFWTALWASELSVRIWASGGLALYWLGIGGDTMMQRCEVILVSFATVGDLLLVQPYVPVPTWLMKNLLVLRLLRALRVLGRRRPIQDFLRNVSWALSAASVVVWSYLVVNMMYAEVGVQLFGGVLSRSNQSLKGTLWFQSAYWSNNFNSLASALMVLFQQAVVNNWFVVADAVREVVGPWTEVYFISYHILSVSVLTNVFVAFLVEAWQREKRWNTADGCPSAEGNLIGPQQATIASLPFCSPSLGRQDSGSSTEHTEKRVRTMSGCSVEHTERRFRTMTDLEDTWVPSSVAVMQDMYASDVRHIFHESRALNVARFKPRDFIREVPGLARLLRSSSVEALLPRLQRRS